MVHCSQAAPMTTKLFSGIHIRFKNGNVWRPVIRAMYFQLNFYQKYLEISLFNLFIFKNNFMATCAGDTQVRVHDFEKKATIYVFNCHSRRVKRLESIHTEPFVFWSASEDGTIRQFDIRCPQHVRLFTYLCSNNNFK